MTPKEHLIDCVKALCSAHGGPDAVGEAAGISPENLKQIVAGTKLPSGSPRGVGPALQRKLDAAFPGWSKLAAAPPSASEGVAYLAEVASKLDSDRLLRLIAAAEMLAGSHGDKITIAFSIAPHAVETSTTRTDGP